MRSPGACSTRARRPERGGIEVAEEVRDDLGVDSMFVDGCRRGCYCEVIGR